MAEERDAETVGPVDLGGVVHELEDVARDAERVSVGEMVDAMGPSSMAAILLVPALLLASPISGIPFVSAVGGAMIALIAGQMVLGRHKIWLPAMLRDRSLPGPALRKAASWMKRPAKAVDSLVPAKPEGGQAVWWTRLLAVVCLALGLFIPLLEIIPFTSSIAAGLVATLALTMLTGRVRFAVLGLSGAGAALALVLWSL